MFQSIITFKDSKLTVLLDWEEVDTLVTFGMIPLTRLMKESNLHKTNGPDYISKFIIECAETLDRPLGVLFKISLKESIVPTEWRKADLVLIFEKSDREVAVNYKLVSLMGVVCKILKKVMRKQMESFLPGRNYFSERHDFRKRSYMTNLLDAYEHKQHI